MNIATPVVFTDGTKFFDDLSEDYIRHDRGYFILAPSGAGKTHFVKHQIQKNWIDGDDLWPLAGADMTDEGWVDDSVSTEDVNRKSDVITNEARKLGFWVIGSSNDTLRPDAIVLPKWSIHRKYIICREKEAYDGGAKQTDLDFVKAHRAWIRKWKKRGVPSFFSVQEAASYLEQM